MLERYLLTDSKLIIEDEELGIHVCMDFDLHHLKNAHHNEQGIKHGLFRLFYPDGSVQAEMFYDNGRLHGPSTFFAQDQTLLARTWYVQGKKIGKVRYFYACGACACVQRYKEGVWEGLQEYFYQNGNIKSLISYQQGALHGDVQLFWESGKQKRLCHFIRGVKEGWDRLWNEEGVVIDEGEFCEGKPVGKHLHIFSDKKEELHYHTPERFDQRQWDTSGKLLLEGVWGSDLTYTERDFSDSPKVRMRKGFWDGQRLCWK